MEFVFVVPRAELFGDCYPQGFTPFGPGAEQVQFDERIERFGYFVERDHAEHDPALKQVIPYSIVVRGEEVLLLWRTKGGGEARLHDKLSIGVGGHVNPEDALETRLENGVARIHRLRHPLARGTRRELDEELVIEGPRTQDPIGLLNDDSNAVGAVHLGWVQIVRVSGQVEIREKDVLQGRFVTRGELTRLLSSGANFETWSAILIRQLELHAASWLREPTAAASA